MAEKTILTGVKPTGQPHIGNYLGAIKPALDLASQPGNRTFLFIADYHSLTSVHDPKVLREMTYEVAATWLACGLDPKITSFYKQSAIPEIFELNWILSCFTPKGLMNRAHAYKAKVQENQEQGKEDLDFGVNMGLYNYPILMSADILMFNAHEVPVGEDQVQHLEIARDIAQKFNRTYGDLMRLPKFVVQKMKLVPGLDGRKMSKSYDNHIPLFLESGKLRKLIMKIKTDSLPPEAPKDPETSLIFNLYKEFATPEQTQGLKAQYLKGIGWGSAKEQLFQVLDAQLSGPRAEYERWMNSRADIDSLLTQGAALARPKAQELLATWRKAMGID
ncbi:MAG: tryptophan--tRNA ligase [Bdellovibrionales bacterium]